MPAVYLFVAVFACSCATVHAGVTRIDDTVHGTGSIVSDSVSGLEWVRQDLAANRSSNEVEAEFGPAGDSGGIRHASRTEPGECLSARAAKQRAVAPPASVDGDGDVEILQASQVNVLSLVVFLNEGDLTFVRGTEYKLDGRL